jgi:hypothetical protein
MGKSNCLPTVKKLDHLDLISTNSRSLHRLVVSQACRRMGHADEGARLEIACAKEVGELGESLRPWQRRLAVPARASTRAGAEAPKARAVEAVRK